MGSFLITPWGLMRNSLVGSHERPLTHEVPMKMCVAQGPHKVLASEQTVYNPALWVA